MISIIQEPPVYAFSNQNIVIKGETNNYMNLVGASSLWVAMGTPIPDGKVLALKFLGNIYEFIFKDNPDPNNDFEVANNDPNFAQLIQKLQTIRCFYLNYTVSSGSLGFIYINAKKIDDRYNITVVYPNTTVQLLMGISPANWSAPKKGFKGLLEIMRQDDPLAAKSDAKSLMLFDSDPVRDIGANGDTDSLQWDVSAAFDGEFELTPPNLDGTKKFLNNVIAYWYRVFEAYGSPSLARAQKNFPSSSNYYFALRGRVKFHSDLNIEQKYMANQLSREFLTNEPKKVNVYENQPKWLSVYLSDSGAMSYDVVYTRLNGTTTTLNFPVNNVAADANKIVSFGVGFVQLGLNSESNPSEIWKYTVQMKRVASVASEVRTYLVNRDNVVNGVDVVFMNELGCWDSVRMMGDLAVTFENETIDGEKPVVIGRQPLGPKLLRIKSKSYRVMTVHSKNASSAVREWLNELLLSEQAYVVENGALTPCLVEEIAAPVFGNARIPLGSVSFRLKLIDRV